MGVLMLLLSAYTYFNPATSLLTIVFMLAIGAVVKGIFELTVRRKMADNTGVPTWPFWVIGIFDIIIGIYLFFNQGVALVSLPFVFAIWFMVDSIGGIISAFSLRKVANSRFWLVLILSVLGLIVGIVLLDNPLTAAITIVVLLASYFFITAIGYFISAFF